MNREELELYDKQLERMTTMLNLPESTPIPVPGTKEWDDWILEREIENEIVYAMGGKGYKIITAFDRGRKDAASEISKKIVEWNNKNQEREQQKKKVCGTVQLTHEKYLEALKIAKRKLNRELERLNTEKEDYIKSDFDTTYEIAKISGEIKGITMIYEALEEVTNDAI